MRKIGVLLIAVVCVVMMAVPVLAYTEVDISGHVGITVQDGNTYLATVPASTLNDEGKGYWDKAMQVLTGQSSDYKVTLRYTGGNYIIDLFGSDAVMTVVSGVVRVSPSVARFSYSASANKLNFWPRAGIATDMIGVYISCGDFDLPDSAQIATYEGQFGIVDDLNNPLPEPKPEPKPDPEPEPYDPPGPPVPDMAYAVGIPFDTGVFDALLWYLRDGIASVGQVLILGVFLLSVVPLFLSILRRYLVHGNENDDGMI